ncbi:hypothetical protein [Kitasatospora sp. NPDC093806]|uniref:hypothetical protein n=1 Tax=Kitasatospora sp. NPDC093806 TaxID=3155075 RepID=UPI00344A0B9A
MPFDVFAAMGALVRAEATRTTDPAPAAAPVPAAEPAAAPQPGPDALREPDPGQAG